MEPSENRSPCTDLFSPSQAAKNSGCCGRAPERRKPAGEWIGLVALPVVILLCPGAGAAQNLMRGVGPNTPVRLFFSDEAVLDLREPRSDLPCTVTPVKPALDFDMRFHTGYEVTVPMRELAGKSNQLTVVFRVKAESGHGEASYFWQRWQVPGIEEGTPGDAQLQGAFATGEGKYHVDWLMRDFDERFCSAYWDFQASLPARDRQIRLALSPATIDAAEVESFRPEPAAAPDAEMGSHLKILIHFAPLNPASSAVQAADSSALVTTLRAIAREPSIRHFSVVAYNLQQMRVIYREEYAGQIDFPALGEALRSLSPGTVSVNALGPAHSDTEFLAELIQQEMQGEKEPDALVFLGPKVMLDKDISREALRQLGEPRFPVFYINYNLYPQANPWNDAISRIVKFFRGFEYTVSYPRDLWFAVTDVLSRIQKQQSVRQSRQPETQSLRPQ